MLNWSFFEYKLTLGVGTIALLVMCSELWEDVPFWVVFPLVGVPLLTFLLVNSDDGENALGRTLQGVASGWYVLAATTIVAVYGAENAVPSKVAVWTFLSAWGALPCAIVLFRLGSRAISGAWRSKREAEVKKPAGLVEVAENLTDLF